MKIITLISAILLFISLISVSLFVVRTFQGDDVEGQNQQPSYFDPSDITVNEQIIREDFPRQTAMSGLVTLNVDRFLNDGVTYRDPMNPGDYILAGDLGYCTAVGECLDNAVSDAFRVTFQTNGNHFNILLLSPTTATARLEAEQFLMQKLNLNKDQMCDLSYHIMTPYWINETYAGQNLGFSFCDDSISVQ